MAFWNRLKHENHKIRLFANQLNRYHTINKPFSHTLIPSLEKNPVYFSKARSYAAPIQKKEEKKEASGVKLNEMITAPMVRLVTDQGNSIISRYEALARAKSLNLDLVEVDQQEIEKKKKKDDENSEPQKPLVDGGPKLPVCKIYDYKKDQLLQKMKEKEHKKKLKSKGLKSGGHKEVTFACKIGDHDLQMKADAVKRLIESGHRVKCTAVVDKKKNTKEPKKVIETKEQREARETKEAKDAKDMETLLSRFSALIEDVACIEGQPHLEKKQAFIVVRHIKFGKPKSGGKKASKTLTSESSENKLSREDEENTNSVQTEIPELAVFDDDDYLEEEVVKVPTKNEQNNAASSVPRQVTENRYAKVSRVVNVQNASQVPNQGKQQQFNANPPPRVSNQIPNVGKHDSSPRIPNHIPNLGRQDSTRTSFPNQIPNLGRQDSPRPSFPSPPNQIPNLGRQDSPRPSFPSSANKGFGIFSAQRENIQPNEQNAPAPGESNRYKKVDPSARSPSQTGPRFNRGPPVSNFEPRSNSNAFPNNANDGQAEFRRR